MNVAHLDYEARSGVDITEVGSHRWSIDPRFEILMASVSRDGDDRVYLWVNPVFATADMTTADNAEAERILAEADIIYAHNAQNEQANTWGAITQGRTCPFRREPPTTVWRCTAAMARKAGLPASLEKVTEALGLPGAKDPKGKKLIKLFCIPDEETGEFARPQDHPVEWREFGNYCIKDNVAERIVHAKLKPFELHGASLATFQFDMRMNQRGIPINVAAARNAQRIIDEVQSEVTGQFRAITGLNPTQGRKFLPWFNAKFGMSLPNLQATTIEDALAGKIPCPVEGLAVLGLYQKVSYAAVKKIRVMLDCVCPDGRVRGGHLYYGAGTGRWSGRLLQPQNFRKTDPEFREHVDAIYAAICRGWTAGCLESVWGDPLLCIANVIRFFVHHPELPMLDGDYSGVEARIIAWEAGQEDALQEWRDYDAGGPKPYAIMAAYVYKIPVEQVTADQLELGKRLILGAGFQMGPDKFQESCRVQYGLNLPLDLCERGIAAFREKNDRIRAYWYALQNLALEAVRNPGSSCGPFSVRRIAGIPFLLFKLRSGRSLAYPHPKIDLVPWTPKKGEEVDESKPETRYRDQLSYWGQIPGSLQWGRIKLYGGKLAENETQATAADFMAHGAITAEAQGMDPFMLVHDQGLSLLRDGHTAKDYEEALGTLPDWAKGMPLKVEAKVTPYFKK